MVQVLENENKREGPESHSISQRKTRMVRQFLVPIQADQRVCLFGRTGSGKTTLAKRILSSATFRWAALDPKHDLSIPGIPVVSKFNEDLDRQIIRVPFDENEYFAWDDAIDGVWENGNRILYVDETTLLTPPRSLRASLGRAIRTGRSRGVGVWCASQRPKDLPSAVFTEAEHFFVFQLTFKADREKVCSFTTDAISDALPKLRNHDYVYYNVKENYGTGVRQR